MYQPDRRRNIRKKLFTALVAAFILGNILLVTPAFASVNGQQTPAGAHTCWPFWPFCWKTPTPTPGASGTVTPTPGKTGTPGTQPTGTPKSGSTPTPTSTPTKPPIHLATTTSFTMAATKIVATDAHLSILPDPLHPVLTFASATIEGMKVTHLSLVFSASGTVYGSGIAIKTSVFQAFVSALSSFTDKADLLILLAGGTVHTLTMTNVSLQVDRYVDAQSMTINGLHITE